MLTLVLAIALCASPAFAGKDKGIDDSGWRTTDVDWYQIYLEPGPVSIGTDVATMCDPDMSDTYIYLFAPDCVTQLAYDDDSGPGAFSLINYTITTAGIYHIKVRGYSSSQTGCYRVWVGTAGTNLYAETEPNDTCPGNLIAAVGDVIDPARIQDPPPPPPPANDTCAGAIEIPRCSAGSIVGNSAGATNDYDPGIPGPSCTGYAATGRDLAYVMHLQGGEVVHLVYTANPSFDTSLYIISDCANPSTTCVAGSDVYPTPEVIDWTAPVGGGTYYVIADGYGSNVGGPFTLDYSITCPPPQGACCTQLGLCEMTSEADCLPPNVWFEGSPCEPNPCGPLVGACCALDGSCVLTSESGCPAPNVWFAGVPCEDNPCPPPPVVGACCFADGACVMLLEADCIGQGGSWMGGQVLCQPNPCDQPGEGACCVGNGECQILTRVACAAVSGEYQGDDTLCEPNPCPPIPTEKTTWGQIKSQYR